MPTAVSSTPDAGAPATSLRERLLNVFASPGDVFEEVVAQPHSRINWLLPTLLVCFFGVGSLLVSPVGGTAAIVESATNPDQAPSGSVSLLSALTVVASAFVGTFWTAFVLWFIGRGFLKVRFGFMKTLEVAGLSGMILALDTVVTSLLTLASGDATTRPALSLFIRSSGSSDTLHSSLAALNVFHLWTTAVLAVGLSKLAGVSIKEGAFWVFGYWLALRLALGCF